MKKLFFAWIFICLFITPAGALDCSQIVINSDRTNDPFLLHILFSRNLTDQVCILKYLGQRNDPYVEEYIFGIMSHMDPVKKDRYEYLLRVLLFSVFHPDFDENELATRVLLNKRGIDFLISQIHTFYDPVLKCQIIWIIPYVHDQSSFSFCMTEGESLLSLLKKTKGMPDAVVNEEIICLLDTIQQIGNHDYLFLCQSFIELSRNKRVVDAARHTITVVVSHKKE
jgi:hypothetical protein